MGGKKYWQTPCWPGRLKFNFNTPNLIMFQASTSGFLKLKTQPMCLSSSDTSDMESDDHSDVTAPRYSPFTMDGELLSSASEGENEEAELESET